MTTAWRHEPTGRGRKNAVRIGLWNAFTSPSFVSFKNSHIRYVFFPVSLQRLLPWVIIPLPYFVRRFQGSVASVGTG